MKGHIPNNIHIDNQDQHPRRSTQNAYGETQLNISPKSTHSNPEIKICTFERDKSGYGFKITGNAPVKVQAVRQDGVAWASGLRENDIIIKVNGTPVSLKQHKDVVALIRKESRVELLVESDTSLSVSTATNSSPKRTRESPVISRIPKYDPIPPRPNSIPKVVPRNKSTSESQLPTSNKYQSIDRTKTNKPIVLKRESEVKKELNHHDSTTSSSECSISTSSADSDSAVKVPLKPSTSGIVSPPQMEHASPLKSNSYNVPKNIIATKHASLEKKPTQETSKNKTIPPDGARSYNSHMTATIEEKPNDQSTYSTLPIKKNTELIHGRQFDDDDKCDEESDNSLSVIEMLSSDKSILSKPSLVAILLSYLKEKFEDLKIMIFYYCCKLYKSMILKHEFKTDAPRMANEIITTFLFDKSPLNIVINIDIINESLILFQKGEKLGTVFDPVMKILHKTLKIIVEDVRGKLTRGIQLSDDISSLVNSITSSMSQEKEMTLLHRTMCNIFNKNQKNNSDVVLATHIGLASMYQYFNNSLVLPGTSIRARSTDSINSITNQIKLQTIGELFKVNTFCSPYQQKLSLTLRKKTKSVNGHLLIDAACMVPEECAICEGLLWGTAPQGMFCTMCLTYYHTLCKKKIKNTCSKKLKKSNSQLNKEERPAFFGRLSRKSSTNSARNVNMSISGDNVNNLATAFHNNGMFIPAEKTGSFLGEGNNELSKSQSEDQLNRISMNCKNIEKCGSGFDFNGFNETDTNIVIQDLVSEDTYISDTDMNVAESFDAYTQLITVFPKVDSEREKKRLIVLLEFYHKTRYILMNLKRFQYSLVNKWPPSQCVYSKALSLDCINPFVKLIKSLVVIIEKCITDQGFVALEQAILDWLSENNDSNLKEWVSLSSNLCCTNSLNIVKQMKQTTLRTIPELIPLMNAKFHKLVIIEELTQIRPLLISLPLIVKNIIKSLSKQEELYSEELIVWRQVSVKMDYLCEYIDRCCIPLVDWINNGSIFRRAEKFEITHKSKECEKEIKDFCLDFPRTLFHFPIFDFQCAKIMTWSTNTKRPGGEIQSAYLKKGTDVLLIFYKAFIVVLQKENDHYVLKPIKPLRNLFDRQPPIIDLGDSIIVKNGGQEENYFILNVISHKPDNALLLRIGFTRLEVVESWMDYIGTKTYSLARSISLFKTNDLKLVSDSLSHFERTPGTVSLKSKTSQELFDNSLFNNNTSEIESKERECDDSAYLSLSEVLAKTSETLEQNEHICAILNVTEDKLSSHMKIIKDEGPKSTDDLTLVLYRLSQSLVQQTHKSIAKSCSKVTYSSELDVDQIKTMLTETCKVIDKWKETVKTHDEIDAKIVSHSNSEPKADDVIKAEIEVQMKSNPRQNVTDERIVKNTPAYDSEMNNVVRTIVEEIIEDAISQVRRYQSYGDSKSYKYVPLDSLLPSFEDSNTYLSEAVITPNNVHLNSPLGETITVSRAQIILHNKTSSYKH